jgi:hypothetical protein
MPTRLLLPLLVLLLAAAAPPLPASLNDAKTTEGWIRQQVQAGHDADLNERCGATHRWTALAGMRNYRSTLLRISD